MIMIMIMITIIITTIRITAIMIIRWVSGALPPPAAGCRCCSTRAGRRRRARCGGERASAACKPACCGAVERGMNLSRAPRHKALFDY